MLDASELIPMIVKEGAEQGGGVGLLMRSLGVRHEPSWAEVRLLIEPLRF